MGGELVAIRDYKIRSKSTLHYDLVISKNNKINMKVDSHAVYQLSVAFLLSGMDNNTSNSLLPLLSKNIDWANLNDKEAQFISGILLPEQCIQLVENYGLHERVNGGSARIFNQLQNFWNEGYSVFMISG